MRAHLLVQATHLAAVAVNGYPEEETLRRDLDRSKYKARYGKSYGTAQEGAERRRIWEQNVRRVQAHNLRYKQGLHSFRLGVNKFADMTNEGFRQIRLGLIRDGPHSGNLRTTTAIPASEGRLAKHWDWRVEGFVSSVKDQGGCGSCWAFSATGAMESKHYLKTGEMVSLSEQNLVDCSTIVGNEGCGDGLPALAFKYVIKNGGIDTEAAYPYVGRVILRPYLETDGQCNFTKSHVGATLTSYSHVTSDDEVQLMYHTFVQGPISVNMDARGYGFQLYIDGIFSEEYCSTTDLNHSVLIVGYDTTKDGRDYWIVKNSWGKKCGMNGYFLIPRNKWNMCGIATAGTYPVI